MKELRQRTYRVIRLLLQYFRQRELKSSSEEMDALWVKIQSESIRQQQLRQRRIFYWSASAAAVLVLLLAGGWWLSGQFKMEPGAGNWLEQYALSLDTVWVGKPNTDIELLLADGRKMQVDAKESVLYTSGNCVLVGNDTVHYRPSTAQAVADEIVTPAGKQVKVRLADGTRMWVNAGTRVVYPHEFAEDRREIFVDGEVYLEVAHNEEAPFYVCTRSFNVQVLGTKFDVSSYQSEPYSSVVLVEGSVKVENKFQDNRMLTPSQFIKIQDGSLDMPVAVDVEKYISWTDKLLVYEEESLPNVLKKLERYYGKFFIVDRQAEGILISGKLELKDDLSKVLHALSYAFPVAFDERADTVVVSAKTNY